ncbi:MAG: hypothetical protein ACSLEN_14210 [Candidatus Malihini olakiniferum]
MLSSIDPTLKGLSKLDDMESKLTHAHNAGLLALNTKTAHLEMIELIDQISRGDFTRAENSMLTLGRNVRKLLSLFSDAILAIRVWWLFW